MRDYRILIWLTQLGLSVAGPLVGFILLALWLRQRFGLGMWVLVLGVLLGISGAVDGFRVSLRAMERMSGDKSKKKDPPPVSFNDHT